MSPFVKIGLFDRIRLYFLRKWTSGYVLVFKRSDGVIVINWPNIDQLQHLAIMASLEDNWDKKCDDEHLAFEAEVAVKALIS